MSSTYPAVFASPTDSFSFNNSLPFPPQAVPTTSTLSTSTHQGSSQSNQTDIGPTQRCSQCKKEQPLSSFPIKLINLQPYLVCISHEWYWNDQKRATHWAPDHTSTLEEACQLAARIKGREGEFEDRFTVEGKLRDLQHIVQSIAEAGGWTAKKFTQRASRAKSTTSDSNNVPSPTFLYSLKDRQDPKNDPHKLTMYYHEEANLFTMTLRPEGKNQRSSGPWARPNRVRPETETKKKVTKSKATNGKNRGNENVDQLNGISLPSSFDNLPQSFVESSSTSSMSNPLNDPFSAISVSLAQRDAQQMPPPPIPPRKKPRRVEPSLVSPSPRLHQQQQQTSQHSQNASLDSVASAFALAAQEASNNPLAHFLSFPVDSQFTDLPFSSTNSLEQQRQQLEQQKSLSSSQQNKSNEFSTSNQGSHSISSSSSNRYTPSSSSTSSSSFQLDPHALTLAELLANPAFDPPNIPLPPRTSSSSSSTLHHHGSMTTTRIPYRIQESPSAAGRELDEAVALALGGGGGGPKTTRSKPNTTGRRRRRSESRSIGSESDGEDEEEEQEKMARRRREEEEDLYEDSIPDSSEEEEEEEELEYEDMKRKNRSGTGRNEEGTEEIDVDRASVDESEEDVDDDGESSFFTDGDGEEGESDEGEEEEEDWLAGFVSKQMPGLAEDDDDDEQGEDDQDDEGDDDDEPGESMKETQQGRLVGTKSVGGNISRRKRTSEEMGNDIDYGEEEEDEVDELESSDGE